MSTVSLTFGLYCKCQVTCSRAFLSTFFQVLLSLSLSVTYEIHIEHVIGNKSHLGSRDDFEWGVVKCALIVFSASKQNEWKMGFNEITLRSTNGFKY
jgi:hypothetical protein